MFLVRETMELEPRSQFASGLTYEIVEARRHHRFKVEVKVRVYPRDCPVVRGDTVDISESRFPPCCELEVPVGEMVRLEIYAAFWRRGGSRPWFAKETRSAMASSSWNPDPPQDIIEEHLPPAGAGSSLL